MYIFSRYGARLPVDRGAGSGSNGKRLTFINDLETSGLIARLRASPYVSEMHPFINTWVSPVKDLLYAEAELAPQAGAGCSGCSGCGAGCSGCGVYRF